MEQIFYTILKSGKEKGEISSAINISDLSRFLAHERTALVVAAKMGMNEQLLYSIMQIVLSIIKKSED